MILETSPYFMALPGTEVTEESLIERLGLDAASLRAFPHALVGDIDRSATSSNSAGLTSVLVLHHRRPFGRGVRPRSGPNDWQVTRNRWEHQPSASSSRPSSNGLVALVRWQTSNSRFISASEGLVRCRHACSASRNSA
jgi:hypothetical protein